MMNTCIKYFAENLINLYSTSKSWKWLFMHFILWILVHWQSSFHELWCYYCVWHGGWSWSHVFSLLMLCCPPTSCAIKDKVFVVVHSPVWTPSPFVSSEAAAALWCAAPSRPSRLTTTTELTERTFCGAAAAANKQMLQLTSERAKEGRNVGAAQCSNVLATLPRSLTDHYRLPGGGIQSC